MASRTFRPPTPDHEAVGPPERDLRLWRRYESLLSDMTHRESSVIHQISSDVSSEVAYYRFFKNKQVKLSQMISHIVSPLRDRDAGHHVLAISDSSEISLKSQINKLQDGKRVGVLSDNKTPGFHLHMRSMCVDAQSGHGLGLSDFMLWNRPKTSSPKSERGARNKLRPWPEKEPYKWRLGIEHSLELLDTAEQVTFVFDVDADIKDLWQSVSD